MLSLAWYKQCLFTVSRQMQTGGLEDQYETPFCLRKRMRGRALLQEFKCLNIWVHCTLRTFRLFVFRVDNVLKYVLRSLFEQIYSVYVYETSSTNSIFFFINLMSKLNRRVWDWDNSRFCSQISLQFRQSRRKTIVETFLKLLSKTIADGTAWTAEAAVSGLRTLKARVLL